MIRSILKTWYLDSTILAIRIELTFATAPANLKYIFLRCWVGGSEPVVSYLCDIRRISLAGKTIVWGGSNHLARETRWLPL